MVTFYLFLYIFCSSSFFPVVHPLSTLSSNFDSDIDLFADAHVLSHHVQLTRPSPSSSGLLLHRHPIRLTGPTSISVDFSFSISPGAGDGVVLLLVPDDIADGFPGNVSFGLFPKKPYVAIEFDTSKDENVGDPNANHVGIDVSSLMSVAVANVSDVNLVLNGGEKLNSWVDYDAGSKRLEVRLGKFGEARPMNPIVSHSIDLGKIWGGERVFVGVSASNDQNSVQVVSVYSWKVSLRKGFKELHSQPVDPKGRGFSDESGGHGTLTILARVIFGTGCVALLSFVVLFVWVIFFQRKEEETLGKITDHPVDIRYERIDVAVDKSPEEDEN